MKNTIISKPIHCYILDDSINADNYEEIAVRLEIKSETIQGIFQEFPIKQYGLIGGFENVSTIPNYIKRLEFAKGIWVQKSFYNQIYNELKELKGERITDVMCFVLLVLRKVQLKNEYYGKPDKITPETEKKRFFSDIIQNRKSSRRIKNIEYTAGEVLRKYDFAEIILTEVSRIISDNYLKHNLDGFAELMFTSRSSYHPGYTPKEKRELKKMFRMFCLDKILMLMPHVPTTDKNKSILINQLFATSNFLDYKQVKIMSKVNKTRCAGKIHSQIQQLKSYRKKLP